MIKNFNNQLCKMTSDIHLDTITFFISVITDYRASLLCVLILLSCCCVITLALYAIFSEMSVSSDGQCFIPAHCYIVH